MPVRPLSRPRARHAKPSRAGQPVVATVLASTLGGGTLALASTAAQADDRAVAVRAAASGPAALPDDLLVERQTRATRSRVALEPPAPVAPAPPPPPAEVAPVLPGCTAPPATGYANGRIPSSALCDLPDHPGHLLRSDAARAFVALSQAYRAETGDDVCITDSYRSYGAQVALRRQKGRLAAAPGLSNHGTGIAVDFCGGVEGFGTAAYRWMQRNAPRFGWVHPSWADPGGRKPEPWHWEYRG